MKSFAAYYIEAIGQILFNWYGFGSDLKEFCRLFISMVLGVVVRLLMIVLFPITAFLIAKRNQRYDEPTEDMWN